MQRLQGGGVESAEKKTLLLPGREIPFVHTRIPPIITTLYKQGDKRERGGHYEELQSHVADFLGNSDQSLNLSFSGQHTKT